MGRGKGEGVREKPHEGIPKGFFSFFTGIVSERRAMLVENRITTTRTKKKVHSSILESRDPRQSTVLFTDTVIYNSRSI